MDFLFEDLLSYMLLNFLIFTQCETRLKFKYLKKNNDVNLFFASKHPQSLKTTRDI